MRYVTKFLAAGSVLCLLSACGSFDGVDDGKGGVARASQPSVGSISDFPVKIGKPYQVAGKTYTPADTVNYDEVGYASYYGRELAGRPTANGETFVPEKISAAHKTLPLPSYVEVTSLETGKTIVVRVNDRGPFANDRLIDLSEGAASQLGITQQGVAGVRVRRVQPPEAEKAQLRSGQPVAERIDTPNSLLSVLREKLAKLPKPKAGATSPPTAIASTTRPAPGQRSGRLIREGSGAAKPTPSAKPPVTVANPRSAPPKTTQSGRFIREGSDSATTQKPKFSRESTGNNRAIVGGFAVQLASFSSRSRADALARKLGAKVEASDDGRLFRVRYGPYASESDAQKGLATARQRGYPNAKIFRR